MDGLKLVQQARQAGLELIPEGESLRIRGPRSAERLALAILERKGDVLDGLLHEREAGPPAILFLRAEHPLAGFRWDDGVLPPGLREPELRRGVIHKRPDCNSPHSWHHVFGDWYCSECWPPTDPLAIIE